MDKRKVTIIDYGVGNLLSVTRAIEHCGGQVIIADNVREIKEAERLILPGVGAFEDGMKELRIRGFIEPIKCYASEGRPLLGICLGMQLLLDTSEEFGMHHGLGLIPGKVIRIPKTDEDGKYKIPHIGWNELIPNEKAADWEQTILNGTEPGASVYFVHSYQCIVEDRRSCLAITDYYGRRLTAVIRQGSLYGCQFHPEKSGEVGLAIIRNFIEQNTRE